MAQSYSEPNTILELNAAHTDNYILVIPNLPTAQFLSSAYNNWTNPQTPTVITPASTAVDGCGNGPEFDPSNSLTNPITSAPQGLDSVCNQDSASVERAVRRERNLDIQNFRLYVQDAELPSVTISDYKIETQFAALSRSGKISFGDLTTTSIVSENLMNYNAILFWLYALHNPEEFNKISGREMIKNYFCEIHLIITNNHREKVAEYQFIDAFPKSLTPLSMSYKTSDKLPMTVTWAHSGMMPSNNYVLRYV
jgi:hypothetical protein